MLIHSVRHSFIHLANSNRWLSRACPFSLSPCPPPPFPLPLSICMYPYIYVMHVLHKTVLCTVYYTYSLVLGIWQGEGMMENSESTKIKLFSMQGGPIVHFKVKYVQCHRRVTHKCSGYFSSEK